MEVHHHSHKPKNWKEYITEFVMLFAAVSLGFIAENIREHNTELKNTNKSLITLYKDIKTDSSILSVAIKARETINKADSIVMKYHNNRQLSNKINELYLFDFLIARRAFPKLNQMALDELNTNGKLNFIEDEILKEKIQEYFQFSKQMEARRIRENDFLDKHHDPIRIKYFDIYSLNLVNKINIDSVIIKEDKIVCNINSLNFNLLNANEFKETEYLNTANFIVSLENADDLYYIKPFQKEIESILIKLREYFTEKNIKYK